MISASNWRIWTTLFTEDRVSDGDGIQIYKEKEELINSSSVVDDRLLPRCLSRQHVYYCILNNSHVITVSYQRIGQQSAPSDDW